MTEFPSRALPDRIGRYTLMQRLAIGGMAELFLARVKGLEGFEKVVVLKRILPHLAEDEDFVRMFLKEARLAATLDHPNIVHVRDIGREDGEYFFTMEYLHGEDLRKVLATLRARSLRLPLRFALSIASQIAAGLHFAHEQVGFDGAALGIIHRDVSPSNVLVLYSGAVKVVDFGIAKAAGPTHASRMSALKGKAAYMSPEQCKARELDRRSDVYAIGLLLFELVTGQPVFEGGNDLALLHRVARGDVPDPAVVWPECPPELRTVILRATALQPEDRYPTAQALQLQIERIAEESGSPASNAALARFMGELFGDRPLPWLSGEPSRPSVTPEPSRTPATKAKAMPMPVRAEATEIAPAPTVISATGATEKVHPRTALASVPIAAPLPAPRARAGIWIAAIAVLATGGIAGSLALGGGPQIEGRQAAPSPAPGAPAKVPRESDADWEVVPQQPVAATPERPDASVIAAPSAESPEPPRAEPPRDEPPEPTRAEPTRAEPTRAEPPETQAAETAEPAASRPGKKPASVRAKPTKDDDGPKHSRPDLPANDDPNGLLPY